MLFPTREEINEIMRSISNASIAVLGDFCIDAYWTLDGDDVEISIETGKQVQHVRAQRYSPGGAGNVVVNLKALGVRDVRVFGVLGDDLFGRELQRELQALDVDTSGLVTQSNTWDTPVYGKPVLAGVEQQRLDFGLFNVLSDSLWTILIKSLCETRGQCDFFIVNQQLPHGWCNRERAAWFANELVTYWPTQHLVDSRQFVKQFAGAALKVNQYEAARLLGVTESEGLLDDDGAIKTAEALGSISREAQFMTRGECGLVSHHSGATAVIPGVSITGPVDPVGAGDTATAMLAACRAVKLDPQQSATMANIAAAITVQKLNQTGAATQEEILAEAGRLAYVYHPTLAAETRHARYHPDSDIEIVEPRCVSHAATSAQFPFQYAVFDHDGTVSTLRQGWETVMEPVMLRAILGDRYETVDSALFIRIRDHVRRFIEQSTGIQTIAQMDALARMVAEYGIIPPEECLDAWGYKNVYNQALMEMVNDRIRRIQRGELSVQDFIMKGAIEFLHAMREHKVKLFLVSGTDDADTVREAELLGYAGLFDGGIYGAKPGSRADTKDAIIKSVLESIDDDSQPDSESARRKLLVIGDGPVEIRLGRRHEGISLGIASNEERRFGLNLVKRRRLIRAGAHLLIPDFSQWKTVISLLARC